VTAFLRIAAGIPVVITLAVLAVPRAHAIDAAPLGNPKSNERYSTEPNSQNDKPKKVFLPMSKYGEAIIEGLEAMGVRVGFSKNCPDGALAAYGRHDNLFLLCSNLNKSVELITEAVAHEAVHALHDCVQEQGISGSQSTTLVSFFERLGNIERVERFKALLRSLLIPRPLTTQRLFRLKEQLNSQFFLMEYEAYALEADPPKVLSLINNIGITRCGPSKTSFLPSDLRHTSLR
jgi:hypothetical protein